MWWLTNSDADAGSDSDGAEWLNWTNWLTLTGYGHGKGRHTHTIR